jgi:hypothetical protein
MATANRQASWSSMTSHAACSSVIERWLPPRPCAGYLNKLTAVRSTISRTPHPRSLLLPGLRSGVSFSATSVTARGMNPCPSCRSNSSRRRFPGTRWCYRYTHRGNSGSLSSTSICSSSRLMAWKPMSQVVGNSTAYHLRGFPELSLPSQKLGGGEKTDFGRKLRLRLQQSRVLRIFDNDLLHSFSSFWSCYCATPRTTCFSSQSCWRWTLPQGRIDLQHQGGAQKLWCKVFTDWQRWPR